MNYTWYYVVRINTKHKVAGWMPCLSDRARAHYRLKNARGLVTISKLCEPDCFHIRRVSVTPVIRDFALHPSPAHDYSNLWKVVGRGGFTRTTEKPLRVFYVLYNLNRRCAE